MSIPPPDREVRFEQEEPNTGQNLKKNDLELIIKDMENENLMIIPKEEIGSNSQQKKMYARYGLKWSKY